MTPTPGRDYKYVACPICQARPGECCTASLVGVHPERVVVADVLHALIQITQAGVRPARDPQARYCLVCAEETQQSWLGAWSCPECGVKT